MSSATVGITGDESALVARLNLEQKVRLLTGLDSWVLYGESEVGLRQMVLSDGPAGVRGVRFDAANPSSSLPCPVALAATWDGPLIEELATALGREARSKGVDVLLGPTVNIIRTPLSGRGFECFSEDPLLTSRIAVWIELVAEAWDMIPFSRRESRWPTCAACRRPASGPLRNTLSRTIPKPNAALTTLASQSASCASSTWRRSRHASPKLTSS